MVRGVEMFFKGDTHARREEKGNANGGRGRRRRRPSASARSVGRHKEQRTILMTIQHDKNTFIYSLRISIFHRDLC